ncbi:MAG: hypothetical protein EU549_03365 [Promethearchaeota archaeon]|nr:MAG: hypothetical protein EU549_03365 [Candidatus Lokiarchaeota archaeon]
MMKILDLRKIQGCYWGLALGDALGKPVEFDDISQIKSQYGPSGIQDLMNYAIWTDDTEMIIAVSRALLRMGNSETIKTLDDDRIGKTFAEEFIKWFDNPGHAPGNTCKSSVYSLIKNGAETWRNSGNNNSKGCGTAMRAAPIGIWFADSIESELPKGQGEIHKLLRKISQIQSEITHGHKGATAAALASSYSVALAINKIHPKDMIDPIERYCKNIHTDFDEAINRIRVALDKIMSGEFKTDLEALHFIGKGWVGEEAFSMALYCAIRYPLDLKECLRTAVNHSGDSDSVGCIAGSIIGAYNGIEIVPNDWVEKLAENNRIQKLLNTIKKFFNI